MASEHSKPGPKPETVRIEEGDVDWKDALKHAMGKPKPTPGGAAMPIERGDRLEHTDRLTGTAMTDEREGQTIVRLDQGGTSPWSVHDIKKVTKPNEKDQRD